MGVGLGHDYKAERAEAFWSSVNDSQFDVIALSECFYLEPFSRRRLLETAAEMGFPYMAEPDPPGIFDPFIGGSGLLVLSRVPITARHFVAFDECADVDCIAQKGCLHLRLAVGTNTEKRQVYHMSLFHTHLQASYADTVDPLIMAVKRMQLRACMEQAQHTAKSTDDVVVMSGDLNLDWHTPEHAKVLKEEADIHGFQVVGYDADGNQQTNSLDETFSARLSDGPVTASAMLMDSLLDYWLIHSSALARGLSVVPDNDLEVHGFLLPEVGFGRLSDHSGVSSKLTITPPK